MSHGLELPGLIAHVEMGDLSGYEIVRHGYQEARVIGNDVALGPLSYSSGDQFDRLHLALSKAVDGKLADNKECYEVRSPGQKLMCLWFHDLTFTLGTGFRPYHD